MPNLDIYNTHMELYPYKQFDQVWLEKLFTATDSFSNSEFACGYIIHEGRMYLPKGTPVSKLKVTSDCIINEMMESDPIEYMSRRHSSYYEPRNKVQVDSIEFLKGEGHQLGLNLGTGGGKRLADDTKIPCPDSPIGYKLMGDIKVGDRVFGSDGKIYNVTGVYPEGVQDLYKITFSDGRISECGPEHLWAVTHPWGPNHVMVKSTEELLKDYKVYRPSMKHGCANREPYEYRYHVQLLSNPVEYPHKDVPVDPYIVGALIGNGCLKESALSISSGDDFVPKKIAEKCGFELNYPKWNYTYTFKISKDHNNKKRVQTKDFLSELPELIGALSHEKKIPEIYLYNDYETRMELLRGLMDTDGSICSHDGNRFNVSYSSCSKILLEQIRWIILSLGFIANIRYPDKRFEKYKHGYHSSVSVRVPNYFKKELFSHPRKLKITKEAEEKGFDIKQKYKYLKIKNIEFSRKASATCISVDSPDHLYLTEDFIVTHNTFCVAYASTELNLRTLVITPNSGLKNQWIKTYSTMFDYKKNELMDIHGSTVMEMILNKELPPADVYFVNHQTIRSFLTQFGPYKLKEFFNVLGAGIKVYDESHMEFANILLIDFLSNTDRTWYLTATFDRSDKTESRCFRQAFSTVDTFGKFESSQMNRKHVIYHNVYINSHISPKNRAKVMGYPSFNAMKYGQYCIMNDENDTAYKTILAILNKTTNMEGKTLIFLPLIENVDEVVKRLKRDYPQKSVAAYHSKIPKDEKLSAENKDIIVTTIKSCGTGKDIKGLRSVICLEPVASKVLTEQLIGRLRPYADDKDTYFWDCIDISIPGVNWFHRARFKIIPSLVKQVIDINDIFG